MKQQVSHRASANISDIVINRLQVKVRLMWLRQRIKSYLKRNKFIPEHEEFWKLVSTKQELTIRNRWLKSGRKIRLSNPATLGEKLEWLKLNYHHPLQVQISDKLAVRDYVRDRVGKEILNQLHGVYDSVSEIRCEDLPEKFVIKTNHWSGNSVFCNDKKYFNREALNELESQLQQTYGTKKVEWPYWHIKPKILVEEYLEDQYSRLVDYKFFCFDGQPKFIVVVKERDPFTHSPVVELCLDLNWKFLPFQGVGFSKEESIPQPKSLDQMTENCLILCKGFPFVRADFYDVYGQCRFGELTLYPRSGCDLKFVPDEWNYKVGDWLPLPEPIRNPQFAYGLSL